MSASQVPPPLIQRPRRAAGRLGGLAAFLAAGAYALFRLGRPPAPPSAPVCEEPPVDEDLRAIEKIAPFPMHD